VPTLAEVEQEVASRCGPYEQRTALATGGASTVVVRALRSTIALGGQTDRFLLRRSATDPDDRVRRVASYDPATGTLTVDDPYDVVVAAGEPLELMVLDPVTELRPAVLRGLARCFFVERAAVPVTAGLVEETLSTALFWITDVGQIRDVSSRVGDAGVAQPIPLTWYRPASSSAGVGLMVDAAPAGVYVVEALRPYATLVGGADAPNGPQADVDVLACPLDYAAAAGHVEAWRRARPTLAPIAKAGYADGLDAATGVFNLMVRSQWWYWDRPDRVRLPLPATTGDEVSTAFVATGNTWSMVDSNYSWRGLSALTWRQVLEGA